MILNFLILGLFIAQTQSAAVNISNNDLSSETARNLNSYQNDQSVKLLNYNLNNYLANLNRFNGGQNAPSKEQLLAAAANLINANQILVNNPNLANYQTFSNIVNNNLNHSLPLNNKPTNFLPINSLSSLPALSNMLSPKVLQPSPTSPTNLAANNVPSGLPSGLPNGLPNALLNGLASGLPNVVLNNLPNSVLNNVQNSPLNSLSSRIPDNSALNTNQVNQANQANFQPINQIQPKSQPNLPVQPVNLNNKNLALNNNANSAFDISNDDANSSLINESIPNYSLNGDNSMPEHWKLLINGMQKFSLSLLKSLHNFEPRDSSAGIILSPFSIWSTLIVTYMGSKTETENEMAEVLNLKNVPKETVLLAYRGINEWYNLRCRNMNITKPLNDDLPASSKMNFCSLANKLFFNSNLKLNKFVKENFDQETQSMDFVHDVEKSRQEMNQWIELKTNNKIKDLIPPGSINSFTNIVLVNAIYFQAKWFTQFDPQKTIKGKFQVNPTEEINVNFMRTTANFMYGISENIKSTILELPYSNQEFSMVLILPESQMGIDSLVKQIKVEHLDEIFMNLYDDEVEVQIPKFKFDQEFDLAGPLYSMGMKRIFDPRFSDFSGFLEPDNSTENEINQNDDFYASKVNKKVIINSVVHKSFIAVDEEGTEAAAATAMLIARSGRPAFPSQFIANRPFMFLIRDTNTNAISFMGIVRRPAE